jgi:peptidyl-prolyl cis-trans isomerase D
MISWMQKHNKYLIVTIWVATIAFIGAGFVGWGSYQYGSKASAIGQVGDIEITQEKFDMTYQNLYNQYNEQFQGQFDNAKAQEAGLPAQAFNTLASQAQLLNLAKQYGIVISDKELGNYVTSIEGFQKDGVFDKVIYETYLKNRRLKTKTFEGVLRDELMVQKLMKLLDAEALPSETDILASALSIADKVAYKVLTPKQIIVNIDDKALKSFWEQFKDKYVTTRSYTLAILWTDSAGTEVTEKEVHDFYDKNSYNYVGADGKLFTFEQAKAIVEQDYKVKKTKKQALKEYVAYKKGERKATETKEIAENSPELSTALWAEITKAKTGDLLKPKAVSSKYATVKLIKITEPQTKSFEQAKVQVTAELTAQKKNELLENKSNAALKNIENEQLTTTDWVTMSKFDNLTPLSQQESKQFLEKLFTSSAKTGMITVSDNVVVYKIVEQKMDSVDRNLTTTVEGYVNQIKKSVFEANLFKTLNETYPAQKFVKGI